MGKARVAYWDAPGFGIATIPDGDGVGPLQISAFTATARAFSTSTSSKMARMRRLGFVTGTTPGTIGRVYINNGGDISLFTNGGASGLGGYTAVVQFGISDTVSGARMFVGFAPSILASNVEPSTLLNVVGMGHGAGQTTMRMFCAGSASGSAIDLGVDFPVDNTTPYRMSLTSNPTSSDVLWSVENLNTGLTASGVFTGAATAVPSETVNLGFSSYRTNNATAAAVGIDLARIYIETPY
jgi:hypothetical protein